jgi:hypothetical protein
MSVYIGSSLKTLSIHRKTTSQSISGAKTLTWTLSHNIENVDVQPVSADVIRMLEGSKETVRYRCFLEGDGKDIKNGDRMPNPVEGTSAVDLEVFQLQKWPSTSGMPAHTEFLLRKI